MLRDQFVLGLVDDAIRKTLLPEHKLTFSRAIQTASLIYQMNSEANILRVSNKVHQEYKVAADKQDSFYLSQANG